MLQTGIIRWLAMKNEETTDGPVKLLDVKDSECVKKLSESEKSESHSWIPL